MLDNSAQEKPSILKRHYGYIMLASLLLTVLVFVVSLQFSDHLKIPKIAPNSLEAIQWLQDGRIKDGVRLQGVHGASFITFRSPPKAQPPHGEVISNAGFLLALREHAASSCLGEAPSHNQDSIVIIVMRRGNRFYQGTGFIVANSAGGDGLNRVVTAAHMIANADVIDIYTGTGQLLGHMADIAHGGRTLSLDKLYSPDIAVLAMVEQTPEERSDFQAIPGLEMASTVVKDYQSAFFGSPRTLGVNYGHSGSPVLDSHGHVVGVFVRGAPIGGKATQINLSLHEFQGVWEGVEFSRYSSGLIRTVAETPILQALNHAGQHVVSSPTNADHESVWVIGYPTETCVVSEGIMGDNGTWITH
jgi:Hepatitis C virus NS3 protease